MCQDLSIKTRVKTILVVDDEPDAVELVEFNLRAAGYSVITAEDGAEAIAKARKALPDLILLDVMLPEIDGMAGCKILKNDPATSSIPIIMLTAKAAEIDRILGLELGADDYVTKPFSPRELILRIKNLLNRRVSPANEMPVKIVAGPITVDSERHVVLVNEEEVVLTATEFKLLSTLASRRGRVQDREQLLRDVWGYESYIDTRTVDTHMRRLRDKLGAAAGYLETVRGMGYRFCEGDL